MVNHMNAIHVVDVVSKISLNNWGRALFSKCRCIAQIATDRVGLIDIFFFHLKSYEGATLNQKDIPRLFYKEKGGGGG